jgi:hypothetical protein
LRQVVAKRGVCDVGWDGLPHEGVRDTGEEGVKKNKNEVDSYDGDASKNVARIYAAATFHFDDADGGVAFSV